jgi:hypothetical protein
MSKLNLPFEGLGDGSMDTSAPNCSPLDTSMDQSIGSAAPIFGAPSAGAFLPRPLALASYAALTTSVDRGKKPWGSGGFESFHGLDISYMDITTLLTSSGLITVN